MKKIILVICLLFLVSCNEEPVKEVETFYRNVKIQEIEISDYQDYEMYIGRVDISGLVKHSFQSSGELLEVYVEEGDLVEAGDPLMLLDSESYDLQLDVARSELKVAKAQYQKALEALSYAKSNFERIKGLFEDGVSSQFDYDQAELNYRISGDDVNAAKELISQAETNVKAKELMLENTLLTASKDGIVMTVLNEETELISAGYPAVVIRDQQSQVIFGVSAKDLSYLQLGDFIEIDELYKGTVEAISQTPDPATQTYEVTLSYRGGHNIGKLLDIRLKTDFVTGSKIPLGAIRSDGDDYVFIVEEGVAIKIPVEVLVILNQEVVVSGLPESADLVIEGIMNLESGDKVKVIQ